MAINLKNRSRMFKIKRMKLKEIPKPKSLLLLSILKKYNDVDNIFLCLAGLRFAKMDSHRQRSLDRKAIRKTYMRLVNSTSYYYQTSLKHKAH